MKEKVYTQYYSKWRNEWIDFNTPPTSGEIMHLREYFYELR